MFVSVGVEVCMCMCGTLMLPCSFGDIYKWHINPFTAHMRFHSRRFCVSVVMSQKKLKFSVPVPKIRMLSVV